MWSLRRAISVWLLICGTFKLPRVFNAGSCNIPQCWCVKSNMFAADLRKFGYSKLISNFRRIPYILPLASFAHTKVEFRGGLRNSDWPEIAS